MQKNLNFWFIQNAGVPKLNRSELETACEDFSNIIDTIGGCTVYKGTLSSGVEIAVASISVSSLKEWSKNSEMAYRRKVCCFTTYKPDDLCP